MNWAALVCVMLASACGGDVGSEPGEVSLARCGLRRVDDACLGPAGRDLDLDLSYNELDLRSDDPALFGTARRLDLSHNALSTVSSRWLGAANRLRALDMSSNNVSLVEAGAFASAAELRWLNLSDNRISQVSGDGLRGLSALLTLDLSSNVIRDLPDGTCAPLRSLQVLYMARNGLTLLRREWLAGLGGLVTLDVSSNNISAIENGTLSPLEALQVLDLHDNQIEALNEGCFLGMTQLQTLDVSSNRISFLENGTFSVLISLRTLNLSNNLIEVLCEKCFLGLNSLEVLDLSSNSISLLENGTFGDLIALLRLNLSTNRLETLEKEYFTGLSSLQTLDLSQNAVSVLENGTFCPIPGLLRLDLSRNRVQALGEECFEGLSRLQRLDVSENALRAVWPGVLAPLAGLTHLFVADNPLHPQHLLPGSRRLQLVDASRTGLELVPGALTRSVRTLLLAGNAVSSVRRGDLDSYPLLRTLCLSDNRLSDVEEDALGRLEALVDLRLDGNRLTAVPRSLPAGLDTLHLQRNLITTLRSVDLQGMPRLRELSLQRCGLVSIEPGTFGSLVNLEVLDLSLNPLLVLSPDALAGPTQLRVLRLSELDRLGDKSEERGAGSFPVGAPEHLEALLLDGSPVLADQLFADTAALVAFRGLRELNVERANVSRLRSDLFHFLPRLTTLRLAGNPWNCSDPADVLWLSEWMRRQEDQARALLRNATCASGRLAGRALIELRDQDFGVAPGDENTTLPPSVPRCAALVAACQNTAGSQVPSTQAPLATTSTFGTSTITALTTVTHAGADHKRPPVNSAVIRIISNPLKELKSPRSGSVKRLFVEANTTSSTGFYGTKLQDKTLLNITVLSATTKRSPPRNTTQTTTEIPTLKTTLQTKELPVISHPTSPYPTSIPKATFTTFTTDTPTPHLTTVFPSTKLTTKKADSKKQFTKAPKLRNLFKTKATPAPKTKAPTSTQTIATMLSTTTPLPTEHTSTHAAPNETRSEHKSFDSIMRDKYTPNPDSSEDNLTHMNSLVDPLEQSTETRGKSPKPFGSSSQTVGSFIDETKNKLKLDHDAQKERLSTGTPDGTRENSTVWRAAESLLYVNASSLAMGDRPSAARAAQVEPGATGADAGAGANRGGGPGAFRGSHPGMFVLLALGIAVAAALATALSHCAKRRRRQAVEYSRQQDIEVRSMSSIGDLW